MGHITVTLAGEVVDLTILARWPQASVAAARHAGCGSPVLLFERGSYWDTWDLECPTEWDIEDITLLEETLEATKSSARWSREDWSIYDAALSTAWDAVLGE
jgi:hypothetical protein